MRLFIVIALFAFSCCQIISSADDKDFTQTKKSTPISAADPTKESKQRKWFRKAKADAYRRLIRAKQKIAKITLQRKATERQLLEGTKLFLLCHASGKITWMRDGTGVEIQKFDERVEINAKEQLVIDPAFKEDSGHFECFSNKSWSGQISLEIVPIKEALVNGLYRFLLTSAAGLFLFCLYVTVLIVNYFMERPVVPKPQKSSDDVGKSLGVTEKEISVYETQMNEFDNQHSDLLERTGYIKMEKEKQR